MKIKRALVGLLFITLFLTSWCVPVHADDVKIIIDSVAVSEMGEGTIIGHVTDGIVGTQITCIVGTPDLFTEDGYIDESKFDMNHLMHIDQVSTGNNGTFLIEFGVDQKWSNTKGRIIFGCSYGINAWDDFNIPELPPGLEVVSNNSVLYGRDVFYVNGYGHTPDNIATAIRDGGNNVYFYLGNYWYNLMDPAATDNSFLVSSNASKVADVESLKPRYYWGVNTRLELKYAEEVVNFMDADVDVVISGYVPKLTGTVSCVEGRTINLSMVNKTDGTTIASDTVTSDDGVFNLNYTLPSLLRAKEYEITVTCLHDQMQLANMAVNIDSSVLALDITGSVSTAKNVSFDTTLKSTNMDLIDQENTFTGSTEVSKTIPNLVAAASVHMTAKGYETVIY